MSRIRKLSEGSSDLSMRRIKQRIFPSKAVASNVKITSSPYSKPTTISRTPSYLVMQPTKPQKIRKSNSISTVRTHSKDSKSLQDESSFLGKVINSPWDSMRVKARIIKNKLSFIIKNGDSKDLHEKYVGIFNEIIEKDVLFNSMLVKIKDSYEDIIFKANSEICRLNELVETQAAEKATFVKMLDRISKENIELGSEMQKMESICKDLKGVIDDIQNVDVESLPKSEMDWKSLVYKNSQLKALVQGLRMDIKDYQYKEEKLVSLIDALKQRGLPVDQVYEEDVRSVTDCESDVSKSMSTSQYRKIPSLELSKVLKSSDSFNLINLL